MLFTDGKPTRDSRFSGAKGGGAATLTERGDETFPVGQFFLCQPEMKLRRTHDTPGRRVQKCTL